MEKRELRGEDVDIYVCTNCTDQHPCYLILGKGDVIRAVEEHRCLDISDRAYWTKLEDTDGTE